MDDFFDEAAGFFAPADVFFDEAAGFFELADVFFFVALDAKPDVPLSNAPLF
ncbi:MAG: hypothetical protein LIO94_11820 [Clostridiales bacterium]|nr:hypothetical protein [Clostridiales bacterium]